MKRGLRALPNLKELRRLLRESQPNIFQGWMYHGNLAATAMALVNRPKAHAAWNIRHALYSLRNERAGTSLTILAGRRFSARIPLTIYNSRLSLEQHAAFGFQGERKAVVPNGFDMVAFAPDPEIRRSVRNLLAIPASAIVFGHVGRLHPMKDHPNFVRAAVAVSQAHAEAYFVMIGRGVTESNKYLTDLVPEDRRDRFLFLGEQSNVPDTMKAFDVLVSSSWSEAFPNVIGEAMATGLATVVTDVGDCRDIVGEAGLVVPARNAPALATAMLSLCHDKEMIARLGGLGRTRVAENFHIDSVVASYRRLYDSLLDPRD